MKYLFFRSVFFLFFIGPGFLFPANGQAQANDAAVSAAKWFASGVWYRKPAPPKPKRTYDAFGRETTGALPDSALSQIRHDPAPDPLVNAVEFAKQYRANADRWDSAFWWLRHTDFDSLPAGRYAVDGNDVYAIITEGPPKTIDSTEWESHRNYEDIHYVIAGKEQIGIIPVGKAKLLRPYEPEKDLASYSAKGKYYTGDPGRFYIVTTEEAHRPGLKTEGCVYLKKLCIKVRKS